VVNATITQQVWQIGVMKAVGATRGRVMRVYLATASVYGLLSLLLAVPLGAIAAHLLASVLLNLLNIAVGPFRLMPDAMAIQTATGLIVPLTAALVPVMGGTRITVRQAISRYGLRSDFGRTWVDRLVGRIRRLPGSLALSLRNTFRRKARVALTLLTLMVGGVMFIMVMSARSSVDNTLESLLDDFGYDVMVGFDGPYRVTRLVEVAERVPGVTRAEVWGREYEARMSLNPTGEMEREVHLWGVPSDSELFSPRIISGRTLLPEDDHAILLNSQIAADENIRVGDEIELIIGERASTWTVVGLVLNIRNQYRDSFVSFHALARATASVNRGWLMMVASEAHDPATQQRLVRDLRDAYTACRLEIAWLQSATEARYEEQSQFNLITYLMLAMAALAAIVGGAGLMSTMSINVVERAREIGVMRAIGATAMIIVKITVAEGILLGILSWVLAVPLSYPGAHLLSRVVGVAWIKIPLDFSYSVGGMLLWLGVVVLLSASASMWPALRATRVSVREALAYE
jgi:putative ABC transport system permease protein